MWYVSIKQSGLLFQGRVGHHIFWQLLMIRWWMYKYNEYNVLQCTVWCSAPRMCTIWSMEICLLFFLQTFSIQHSLVYASVKANANDCTRWWYLFFSSHCRLKTLAHCILTVTQQKTRQGRMDTIHMMTELRQSVRVRVKVRVRVRVIQTNHKLIVNHKWRKDS